MRKRKILSLILMCSICCLNGFFAQAQQYFLHAEYRNDWYGSGYQMTSDIPGYPSVTLQAETQADQFVIEADNSFNKWRKFPASESNLDIPENYSWFAGGGITDNFLVDSTMVGHYYTTRIKDAGYASTRAVIMKTTNAPVEFAAISPVSQSPSASMVLASTPVQVTVNLAGPRSPEEKVYVRYTNDNWLTSASISVSFPTLTATSGSTLIPGQSAGTTVQYYAFSSTLDSTALAGSGDADLVTLRFATNGGLNYTYLVGASPASLCSLVFTLDMSGQTISPSGVFLAHSLNGFALTSPMTALGNNIFTDTLLADTSLQVQYLFVNGNGGSAQYEIVPGICGTPNGLGGFNRFVSVPNQTSFQVPTVCFSLCNAACTPVFSQVVFKVDMSQQNIDPSGVFLAGTFNGWNAGANSMSALGNGIYVDTLFLDTSLTIQYKFLNGSSFNGAESVPSSCGVPDGFGGFSRQIQVPNQDSVLAPVCFNLCLSCPLPFLVPVVLQVNMTGTNIGPGGVHLAGTFNNFSRLANPMTLLGNGVYVDTLQLDTAAVHYYKFLNDTSNLAWENVPASCGFAFGLGNDNRRLFVPENPATLPIVCFGLCDNSCAPAPQVLVPVVFGVNMSQQTVSPAGVFLAGTFNAFSTSANPMTDLGNGIYVDTVLLDTGAVVQYKFVNGTGGSAVFENVPSNCGQTGGGGFINREIQVPGNGGVLPMVCFGECNNCLQPALVDIVLSVNMSTSTIDPQGVFLAGSFNNWSTSANPMTPVGNGIYVDTLSLDTSAIIQYKFLNGNSFSGEEQVPSTCGVSNGLGGFNRVLAVPQQDSAFAPVCFSSCSNCPPLPLVNVTFRVNMSQTPVSPDGLHLAGSFNGFSPTATPMTAAGGGIYEATVALDTTSTIIYKFNNGNLFTTEEIVPAACGVPGSFGGFDRQLRVPEQDSVLPLVCFSQCVDCIQPVNVNVTFRVDLGITQADAAGVFLAGTFNGWSTSATPMTNTSANVWEVSLALDTTQTVQYKFVNGNIAAGYEIVPTACGSVGGGGVINRQIAVPESNSVLPLVCFGSCSACVVPVLVDVVFSVNMSLQSVSSSGVFLAGTFNGFNTTSHQMTSVGNGIYVDTLALDTASIIQYKFVNGSGVNAVFESVPSACGSIGGGGIMNRQLSVPSSSFTLPTVCFGECQDCVLPVFSDITFRVNMSATQVSAQGVHLAGTFNNFSSVLTPMNPVGNGVYEITLSLDTTFNVQYKFVNGSGSSAIFEQPGSACGVPDGFGGFNRSLNVPGIPTNLPLVCFSECVDCLPVKLDESADSEIAMFPNPAQNRLYVKLSGYQPAYALVYNTAGQQISVSFEQSGELFTATDIAQLSPGMYVLVFLDRDGHQLFKSRFIKQQ